MTKNFCDICGEPAVDPYFHPYRQPLGKKWTSWENVSPSERQCKITARAIFGLEEHERGFGGPPDLCGKCILDLVDKIKTTLRKKFDVKEEK